MDFLTSLHGHCPRALGLGPENSGFIPDIGETSVALENTFRNMLEAKTCPLQEIALTYAGLFQVPQASPLHEAIVEISAAVQEWKGYPYHSAMHHVEVTVNAMTLVCLNNQISTPLTNHMASLILVAALGHDYQLKKDRGQRYQNEAYSGGLLADICLSRGMSSADVAIVRYLVLGTCPDARYHGGIHIPSEVITACGLSGEARLQDQDVQSACSILSDADLFSSSALSLAWHHVMNDRLAEEYGKELSWKQREFFFTEIVGRSFLSDAGQLFNSNLDFIRRASLSGTSEIAADLEQTEPKQEPVTHLSSPRSP